MRLDPQDLTRAQRLYPLIEPLCRDGAARRDFIAQARQAASAPSDLGKIERYYALDILEHVAVACARGRCLLEHHGARRGGRGLPG
jgi:hypothetical protein